MPILEAVAGYERENELVADQCELQNAYLRACAELSEMIEKHTRHEATEAEVRHAEKTADDTWALVERRWAELDGRKE